MSYLIYSGKQTRNSSAKQGGIHIAYTCDTKGRLHIKWCKCEVLPVNGVVMLVSSMLRCVVEDNNVHVE